MQKKILLIEDNPEMRENTAELLELASYDVYTAENGKEGVEQVLKIKPDLIICDIMMPILDGYGVLHLLSKKPETAGIPFIFLTAKTKRNDQRRGMEMGADDYITKPFDDEELIRAIESRLKKSDMLKKEFSKNLEGLNKFMSDVKSEVELKKLTVDQGVKYFKKKENIYLEGNYPRGIFFISKGKVKTYKTNEQGKELITGLLKEGEFFGYLALFEEKQYSDSAEALENSEISLISKDDFQELVYKNSEVSRKFLKMLSDDLHEKENQLINLAYNSVRKRIAESLLVLCSRFKKENQQNIIMNISREDIANLAGTATETTIRTLGDFDEEGLIEISGKTIAVKNYQMLERMKN